MPEISAVIITYNEESFIDNCLSSLHGVADEIIVVDSFSTDRTEEICRKHGVKFFRHEFTGFRDQKNYALTLASNKHVLSLDADEALSEPLRNSILKMKHEWKHDGYFFNRRNNYCGQWIRFSASYPDRQLRLFRSDKGEWGKLNLHERFILSNGSTTGRLKGDLLHWPFLTREDHVSKMNRYSEIGAREYHKAGKKAYFYTPFLHFFWGFFRSYFINLGILDGRNGYLICTTYARFCYNKYSRLRQLNRQGKKAK